MWPLITQLSYNVTTEYLLFFFQKAIEESNNPYTGGDGKVELKV